MGIISRTGDLFYAFRFLKLLVTPFEKTKAFELGIIDKDGAVLKKRVDRQTPEEKSAYTVFHRLVFNLKRLIGKAPGGKSLVARYGAALFLIKEHCELKGKQLDKEIFKYLQEADLLEENLLEEFTPITKLETEKTFQLRSSMIINEDHTAERGDTLIHSGAKPVGKIYGISLFRMYNLDQNKMMFCSGNDLK